MSVKPQAPTMPEKTSLPPQSWQPNLVYRWYRLFLSGLLVVSFFYQPINTDSPWLKDTYFLTTIGYTLLCVTSVVLHYLIPAWRWDTERTLLDLIIDVLVIITLAHLTQTDSSHLTILLFVTISASAILLNRHLTTMLAAIATVAILCEQLFYTLANDEPNGGWLRGGTLGAVLFITALLTQKLTTRLRESEHYAQVAAADLLELQKLNHHIIHRMRTGILVVDDTTSVRLFNNAASELLASNELSLGSKLESVCPRLYAQLSAWRTNPSETYTSFQANEDATEIMANFAMLQRSQYNQTIIFIDDASRMAHQAQQLKLASLGQLTAAIAHEVRNPLGAISHAAQLLMESRTLGQEDIQMTDIIQKHCLRVNNIIENVLQLSRRHNSALKRIDLKQWCEWFVQEFIESSPNSEVIDVSALMCVHVQVDTSQLRQVLNNLLENGLRYSQLKTGTRSLTLSSGYLNTSQLPFLDITDDGAGVPPEHRGRLFEPFFTSEPTGTGLGLYIARELCQMNHASLNYVQKQDRGACFRVTFAHPNRVLAA